ncbi:MAG: signal recognition particle-docking protein FtsY [Bacillota bacterium]
MEQKTGIFQRLKQGLSKTRDGILAAVFSGRDGIDDDFFESLEEALIMADVGMELTEELLDELRARIKAERLTKAVEARTALRGILAEHMRTEEEFLPETGPSALLIVGVNGVGKTTSIGKLANYYKQQGRRLMLAAADTFRAAAAEQLGIWAERAGVPMIRHGEGADPAAVVYDAIASFKAKGCDLLICDTAGRLHNKKNLMNELEKIRRVISRELPDAACRVLLVLDATTGQNAIAQAKAFSDSAGLTDVVLTKLDGTAKGGMAIAVKDMLGLPVRFVGVGEGLDDLQPFDAEAFAAALLGE